VQEHQTRRYEAFSDVVIGFSLAQTGSILTIPERGVDLVAHPIWFFVFLWTFANICGLWWFHHRLFTTVWRPRTVQILLNFALLAAIVLATYMTGLFAHVVDIWIMRLYYVPYAVAYALMTAMCANARDDWRDSPRAMLGIERGFSINLTWTLVFSSAALLWFAPLSPTVLGMTTWVPFTVGVVLSIVFGRRYRAREAAFE
jgi:uncharacterized membrane protein